MRLKPVRPTKTASSTFFDVEALKFNYVILVNSCKSKIDQNLWEEIGPLICRIDETRRNLQKIRSDHAVDEWKYKEYYCKGAYHYHKDDFESAKLSFSQISFDKRVSDVDAQVIESKLLEYNSALSFDTQVNLLCSLWKTSYAEYLAIKVNEYVTFVENLSDKNRNFYDRRLEELGLISYSNDITQLVSDEYFQTRKIEQIWNTILGILKNEYGRRLQNNTEKELERCFKDSVKTFFKICYSDKFPQKIVDSFKKIVKIKKYLCVPVGYATYEEKDLKNLQSTWRDDYSNPTLIIQGVLEYLKKNPLKNVKVEKYDKGKEIVFEPPGFVPSENSSEEEDEGSRPFIVASTSKRP